MANSEYSAKKHYILDRIKKSRKQKGVMEYSSDVLRHLLLGGGAFSPIDQLLLLKKKVTVNTVAKVLAASLTFDQLSCKFDNIGGARRPPWPHGHIPEIELCHSS